jgi:glycosyltransferase involved in cell wall biosynthesis
MAVGLPAVASPQQSYVEAIAHRGGGIIAVGAGEWWVALERLRDAEFRARLGRRARETVLECYSTPVVARQYAELLASLA